MQDYRILLRLLGIERYEVPMKFDNGKLVFDGNLNELEANLRDLDDKLKERQESIRDSMKRYLITVHGARFLKRLEEAINDYYGRNEAEK